MTVADPAIYHACIQMTSHSVLVLSKFFFPLQGLPLLVDSSFASRLYFALWFFTSLKLLFLLSLFAIRIASSAA